MRREIVLGLLLMLALPTALAQEEEDPFADANESTDANESDPFATYEQRRNETFQAKQNDTAAEDDAAAATPTSTGTVATPTPTATPSATPAADTPGVGLIGALAALGVALIVLRRK